MTYKETHFLEREFGEKIDVFDRHSIKHLVNWWQIKALNIYWANGVIDEDISAKASNGASLSMDPRTYVEKWVAMQVLRREENMKERAK